MLPGIPGSAICVQGFDDSLNSAIHTTYRISLRPSSLRLPRHPWFAIVKVVFWLSQQTGYTQVCNPLLPFGFVIIGCFLRCLIKLYRSAVEGRGRYGYVQTESPAGLNIHLCRMLATKRRVRFAVGKSTPRDPGTIRTSSDARTGGKWYGQL